MREGALTAEILMMGSMPSIEDRLASCFELHRLWLHEDRTAFLTSIGHRIRGIVTYSGAAPLDSAILTLLPRIEIITNMGAGYESIDIKVAKARNIVVTNAGGLNAVDVAEHAFGLILSLARGIPEADRYVRAGRWKAEGRMKLGRRLSGRKLGILGLGHIGLEIARFGTAFDMPVYYHNRRPVGGLPYQYVDSLRSLARMVEILAIAAPGGPETRHLVNREILDALGPHGMVINIGRGSIIDESALVDALSEGTLGGAGLDVFEDEPEIPAQLLPLSNVVVQPHIAGATREGVDGAIDVVVQNIVSYFAGGPISHRVA